MLESKIAGLLVTMAMALGAQAQGTGVLIMAHGGDQAWNSAVEQAVTPIRKEYPVALAFGMADPITLQNAVDELVAAGVQRIVVVRLFLSGDSFRHTTEYLFGKRDDPPQTSMHAAHAGDSSAILKPLELPVDVTIGKNGLLDSELMGDILAKRVRSLSQDPPQESVLILAHGPASDSENERWIKRMNGFADQVRPYGFQQILIETLREDWPERRAAVEERVREFVRSESTAGRTVLVVPFRLFGFGPYADVLEGLDYRADGTGLLPDEIIAEWIREEIGLMEVSDPDTNQSPR